MHFATPAKPYVIRSASSCKRGKSLEELMFEDYNWLFRMKRHIEEGMTGLSKLSDLHLHLFWLMERGENCAADMVCLHCGRERIELFGHRFDFKNRKDLFVVSCKNLICKGKILVEAPAFPIKFSSILKFGRPAQPHICKFFKELFFPDRENPSVQEMFEFFAKQSPAT